MGLFVGLLATSVAYAQNNNDASNVSGVVLPPDAKVEVAMFGDSQLFTESEGCWPLRPHGREPRTANRIAREESI